MKIGILTMHRVINYGSALQAYALLHYIASLGHYVELINYKFPNKPKLSFFQKILFFGKAILSGRFEKNLKFNKFYKKYFVCSKAKYDSPEALIKGNYIYDIVVTGSDQVWNPVHIKGDYSFFLPFLPKNIKKVSYASSFSVACLPKDIKCRYKELLSSYSHISVREKSGIDIIKNLLGTNAELVCDPTLLLKKNEWNELVVNYKKPIKKPYILVYILTYSYNPYPEIDVLINKLQEKLKFHIIYLDGRLRDFKRKNTTVIKNAGPLEFINLVRHASFILTTSFHGTAFAINFGIPFYSVIKDKSGFDNRVLDLLEELGCSDRAIVYNDPPSTINISTNVRKIDIEAFRERSCRYLCNILQ